MPGYKLYLQEGGEVHEGLKCSHCRLVLKDPIQTSQTGQRYCKECFEDARWFDYAMCELVLFYWPYFNRSSTSELAKLMIDCNDVVSNIVVVVHGPIHEMHSANLTLDSIMLASHFKNASFFSIPYCFDKRLIPLSTLINWKHPASMIWGGNCLFLVTQPDNGTP